MTKISAGSFDLNKWLFGGYEEDIITMIAGPPGSGKTNFVILAACSQAKKGNKVLFVDTEGGFSVDRVKQIVGEEYEKYLDNFIMIEPTKFEEQKKLFNELLSKMKKENISLIVIDGISMLYRLETGDSSEDENKDKKKDENKFRSVNKEMARQMRVLAEISRKKKIPILITNQTYFSFLCEEDWRKGVKREMNIVGGDLFKYWSKCIIQLSNEKGRRKAFLLKHRSLPQKEMSFEIRDKGIFKRGW
jgi:DNA repair protein RadB